jgi:hypothetical protein
MSFLAPAFLLGLAALAIPVFIHLIQRERKRVIEFPSLMFVRRIPYQSVRRRRIRHWLLLMMRAAAILMIVAAFARPFLRQAAAAAAIAGGSREIVIVLDQSASMGFGDHWQRARDAAHQAVRSLGADDRATLVLFGRNAEESMRATSDRVRLDAAIDAARVGSDATRYGPALKLAESILARSQARRREAIVISDFQKTGWSGAEDVHFPDGMTLTPVSVATSTGPTANLAVPSVTFARASFSGQERITVTAGLANKGSEPVNGVPVTLEIDGHQIQTQNVNVGGSAATSVSFTPFTLAEPNVRGTIRAGSDPLPADNVFHFVLAPSKPVSLLVVESGSRDESTLYLSKALAIGSAPAFQVDVMPVDRVTPAHFDKRAVVILNDAAFPPAGAGGVLKRFVERGGGLLVVVGEHTAWPIGESELLPGRLGSQVDRASGRGGTIGFRDYSHPVFEVFKAPRSGDFSGARIFRYRSLEMGPTDRVLARFDDGAVAAAERKVGAGRVIVWTSTLDDSWSDLALKPVFLPLVHQLVKYLAQYEPPSSWFTVGQVLDLSARLKSRTERVVVTPSNRRITQAAGAPGLLELNEQGVYEVRAAGVSGGRPEAIAVNLDPLESDLTPLDPRELVAAVTGQATPGAAPTALPSAPGQVSAVDEREAERRQAIWWYLLMAGVLILAAETVISNRLSRREKFL